MPLPLSLFLSWCQFSSLRAEKKSEKVESLKSDAELTCLILFAGRAGAEMPEPRAVTTGQEKGRGGDGHTLFFIHSDKWLSTPIRVPQGQEVETVPAYYFTLVELGKGTPWKGISPWKRNVRDGMNRTEPYILGGEDEFKFQ